MKFENTGLPDHSVLKTAFEIAAKAQERIASDSYEKAYPGASEEQKEQARERIKRDVSMYMGRDVEVARTILEETSNTNPHNFDYIVLAAAAFFVHVPKDNWLAFDIAEKMPKVFDEFMSGLWAHRDLYHDGSPGKELEMVETATPQQALVFLALHVANLRESIRKIEEMEEIAREAAREELDDFVEVDFKIVDPTGGDAIEFLQMYTSILRQSDTALGDVAEDLLRDFSRRFSDGSDLPFFGDMLGDEFDDDFGDGFDDDPDDDPDWGSGGWKPPSPPSF